MMRSRLQPPCPAAKATRVEPASASMSHTLLLLPGDGIGPEIMAEVEKLIEWLNAEGDADFRIERGLVGGCAYDAHGEAISEGDMDKAMRADAEIFGAVGGPKCDGVAYE